MTRRFQKNWCKYSNYKKRERLGMLDIILGQKNMIIRKVVIG